MEGADAELYAIYLLEDAQGAGIGTGLLRAMAAQLTARGYAAMDVWVLEENASKAFYVRTGAHYAASKEIEIGGAHLLEAAYVWSDLRALATLPVQ